MDDIEAFRLLDLPVLVLVKILRKMRFVDLFILAQHYPPLKRLIQTDVKRHNYAITIQNHGSVAFQFVNLEDDSSSESIKSDPKSRMKRSRVYTHWQLGKSHFPCRFRDDPRNHSAFLTHWNDPFKGARELYKEINDLFSLPIHKVQIKLKYIEGNYKPFFRWLGRLGNIPKFEIYGKDVDFQAYMWTMEHAKPSEKLVLLARPYEYFKKGTLMVEVPEVCVDYGRWVSLDNLLAMKSKSITIVRSILSAGDLNQFLRRFKEGSNPNLNKLTIVFKPDWLPDYDECFEGLNFTQIDGEFMEWMFELDNGDQAFITVISLRYILNVNDEDLAGFDMTVDRKEEISQ